MKELGKVKKFVNFFYIKYYLKMVFTKEDFTDLTTVKLLQTVWYYTDTIHESGERTPGFIFNYNHYCEKLPFEKWLFHELPRCSFILNKIKEQKSLSNSGSPADFERYLEFLRGLKKID